MSGRVSIENGNATCGSGVEHHFVVQNGRVSFLPSYWRGSSDLNDKSVAEVRVILQNCKACSGDMLKERCRKIV